MVRLGNLLAAFLLCLLTSPALAQVQDEAPAPPQTKEEPAPPKDPRLSRDTPEGTLRLFTFAMMIGHEQLLKMTIIPVSDEEMAYLLKKPKGGPDAKTLKEFCAGMKVRALKPGDTFKLPGAGDWLITDEDVNDECLVLVIGDSPLPSRLFKSKGFWWVDAGPVIAGRKAAAELRQKKAEAKKASE